MSRASATMGIRFYCPNGCKVHVKSFQAGRRGICPHCGAGVDIPLTSTRGTSKKKYLEDELAAAALAGSRAAPTVVSAVDAEADDETELLIQPLDASQHHPAHDAASLDSPPPLPSPTSSPGEPLPSGPPPLPRNSQGTDSGAASGAMPGQSEPAPPSVGTTVSFRDDPDAIWYVRPPMGGQYGPAGRDVMLTWLAEGRISPDALLWRDGWRDWRAATDVFPAEDFPQLRIPDAVPGLDRLLEAEIPNVGIPGGIVGHRTRRRPMRNRFLWLLLAALGAGALVAVYVWARYS